MDYKKFVDTLIKPGSDIAGNITDEEANLWHLATGVAGESGELLDAVKKAVIYKKPLDVENVIEELGDLEFYMQGIRSALNITREEVIEYNIKKLSKRYASMQYSDQQAQDRRDKE